jgi:flagellar assembly factor FliW
MEYAEEDVIRFPRGIYGFEDHAEFILVRQNDLEPLVFLQSLHDAGLCLPALPVRTVCPDYQLSMQPEDLETLGLPRTAKPEIGETLVCLAILRVHEDGVPTANLLAPVVVALPQGLGVQAIGAGPGYSHQHRVEAPAPC